MKSLVVLLLASIVANTFARPINGATVRESPVKLNDVVFINQGGTLVGFDKIHNEAFGLEGQGATQLTKGLALDTGEGGQISFNGKTIGSGRIFVDPLHRNVEADLVVLNHNIASIPPKVGNPDHHER